MEKQDWPPMSKPIPHPPKPPSQPAILPEDQRFRARRAFIKFQQSLDWLELELAPLKSEMSLQCQGELDELGGVARGFFMTANQELFSRASKCDSVRCSPE